jgi:hypothetical protein
LQLLLNGLAFLIGGGSRKIESDERANGLASSDVPDDVVLAVLFSTENGVALVDLHRAVRPGSKVALVGREVDKVDARVHETLLS